MLIPKVMNGLEKSITFSRSAVMVSPATARSAFCREGSRGGECREGQGTAGWCTVLWGETWPWGEQQEFIPYGFLTNPSQTPKAQPFHALDHSLLIAAGCSSHSPSLTQCSPSRQGINVSRLPRKANETGAKKKKNIYILSCDVNILATQIRDLNFKHYFYYYSSSNVCNCFL